MVHLDIISTTQHPQSDLSQVADALAKAGIPSDQRLTIARQILAWTNNQFELTQYLLEKVINTFSQEKKTVSTALVDEQVETYFSPDLLTSDLPNHRALNALLIRLQQALLQDRQQGYQRLQYYQTVLLRSNSLHSNYADERQALLDVGLILYDQNRDRVKVASPIYRRIFNVLWIEQQLEKPFVMNKGHWLLFTSLLSIVAFVLLQSLFRYIPLSATNGCNKAADLRDAVRAQISLNPQQMQQSIERLLLLKERNQLSGQCQDVLHDLQYSYSIYVAVGTHNHPLEAANHLCQIPESYYIERNSVPWFSRWSNIYHGTNFARSLASYVENNPCPAYDFLNRAS